MRISLAPELKKDAVNFKTKAILILEFPDLFFGLLYDIIVGFFQILLEVLLALEIVGESLCQHGDLQSQSWPKRLWVFEENNFHITRKYLFNYRINI